jgi:threonine synthase
VFACPEGAVTVAAARRLRRAGWIGAGERVVLVNTGAGSLYPEAARSRPRAAGAPDP